MDLLPATASPLKLYRQAKRLLVTTSRAKEPDWYRRADELDLQWHLWIGSYSGFSAIYSRSKKQWWAGPDLPPVNFETDEQRRVRGLDQPSKDALHELLRQIFAAKEFGARTKSLGIVIHLADGVRMRELAPEFSADGDFASIDELLISAPDVALGDDTVSAADGCWRLLPLLGVAEGGRRALAVQVSSKLRPIVDEFRRYGELRNLPVVVNARSAQLEAISGAAYLHPALHQPGSGPTLVLVQYETMSLIFALGDRRELLLARPLVHRSSPSLTPTETADVLTQTAALLNIKDPSILMVSLAGVGEQHLHDQLAAYLDHFPNARHRCVETTQDPLTEGIPGRRFEFAASVQETPPTAEEQPFQKELRERWTRQDFFGPDAATAAKMPSRADLRLLKIGGMVQKAAAVAILAFCGWTGMDFIGKLRSEAWRLSTADADFMEMQLAKLAKERGEWQHWDRLLGKRSEGWLALQTLLEIFPQDGGVILGEARYRAEVDDSVKEPETVGLKRAWEVSGYANPEVAVDLPTLGSRNRVAEVLNGIAERNHAPYLKVGTPTRSLEVAFQQRQGTMQPSATFPANVARHFRTTFDLKISQSLNSQDELAISTSPLPGQE